MKISRKTAKLSFYASLSAAIACACNITAGQSNMKHEVEDTHSSSAEIDYTALERELSKASDNLASAQGRDFILVLGNTDSGKSTLINYLQGHKFLFELDTETEDTVLVRSEDAKVPYPSPVIGRSFESCTLVPEIFQLSENLFACDTAGFGDSRGITEEAIAYLGLQMAVRAADRIRAVVAVVEESQLTSQKGVGFRGVAQVLQSMFKGEIHHPSLHLLFSKGQKTRNALLASMRKMQAEVANLCSKEKDPQKAKSHFEIASVLETFCKTENVYPFSPCDRDFREIFFKRIQNSPPIPTSTISIASSTKYGQVLDKALCTIALQGNQTLRTMQSTNAAMHETIADLRHNQSIIARQKAIIEEQEGSIGGEKARIVDLRAAVQESEQAAQREAGNLAPYEERIREIEANIERQRNLIDNTERSLNTGRTDEMSTYQRENTENCIKLEAERTIDTSEENKRNCENSKAAEQRNIERLSPMITAEQTALSNKTHTLNHALDQTSEVSTAINTRDSISGQITSKSSAIYGLRSRISNLESELYRRENDTTMVKVHDEGYDEYKFYGVVKEGTEKPGEETFEYTSGSELDLLVVKGRTGSEDKGTSGRFTNVSRCGKHAEVSYIGPSHYYGFFHYWVYSQERHTQNGISGIASTKSSLDSARGELSNTTDQKSRLESDYSRASSAVDTARQSMRSRLNGEISTCNSNIASWQSAIAASRTNIGNYEQQIASANATIERSRGMIARCDINLARIRSDREAVTTTNRDMEATMQDYRSYLEHLQQTLQDANDALANCRLSVNTAQGQAATTESSIEGSEALVQSYQAAIRDAEGIIAGSEDQTRELHQRFDQLIAQMHSAKGGLRKLEDENKVKMLYTICNIMKPKLEVVNEFFELHKTLPEILDSHELLISECQSMQPNLEVVENSAELHDVASEVVESREELPTSEREVIQPQLETINETSELPAEFAPEIVESHELAISEQEVTQPQLEETVNEIPGVHEFAPEVVESHELSIAEINALREREETEERQEF